MDKKNRFFLGFILITSLLLVGLIMVEAAVSKVQTLTGNAAGTKRIIRPLKPVPTRAF